MMNSTERAPESPEPSPGTDRLFRRSTTKPTRILVADDHPLTLDGIAGVLSQHFEIVATVSDGRAAVEKALELEPDLIAMDITMPLLNGIDAAKTLRKVFPEMKLMFVTMHVNPAYLEAALHAGATGYVLKSAVRGELLEAVKAVLGGRIYVSPGVSGEQLKNFRDPALAAATLRLSTREREVLQLVAEGKAAKEIAFLLSITAKTVAFHRENIKRKLGLRSTAELTKYALEQGLI